MTVSDLRMRPTDDKQSTRGDLMIETITVEVELTINLTVHPHLSSTNNSLYKKPMQLTTALKGMPEDSRLITLLTHRH
jgi:hypothetical protein